MKEVWKDIKGYPGYQVSNQGNVRSNLIPISGGRKYSDTYRTLILSTRRASRPTVVLYDTQGNRKSATVSRLVAEAFIPNPEKYPVVRHMNDVPYDNDVRNLCWGTYKDNVQDAIENGTFTGLHMAKPVEIFNEETLDSKWFASQHECAEYLGIAQSGISVAISTGKKIRGYSIKRSYYINN